MKASEAHKKYIEDLNKLTDQKGSAVRTMLQKSFKSLIQRSGNNPQVFLKLAKESKSVIIKLLKVQTIGTARESLKLGNKFLQEKRKNEPANL